MPESTRRRVLTSLLFGAEPDVLPSRLVGSPSLSPNSHPVDNGDLHLISGQWLAEPLRCRAAQPALNSGLPSFAGAMIAAGTFRLAAMVWETWLNSLLSNETARSII